MSSGTKKALRGVSQEGHAKAGTDAGELWKEYGGVPKAVEVR